jgi:hypothetical protein
MDDSFYAGAPQHLRTLMLEQARVHLASQMDLAKGADTRALGLLTVSATLSAAGLAIAVARASEPASALFVAAVCFTLSTFLAALMAISALWPTGMFVPGLRPSQFLSEVESAADQATVEGAVLAALDRRIKENGDVAFWHAMRTRTAMLFLGAAPLAGAAGALHASGRPIAGTAFAVAAVLAPAGALIAGFAHRSAQKQ